jgi:transcriptional regulator with XRE-family HTH domain
MSRKLDNYLRTYRRRSGLSQKEMAFLLGCREESKVSRYERRVRCPNSKTLIAYEVIFGTSTRELFTGTFEKVEKATAKRAQLLAQKLNQCAPTPLTNRKLARLAAIASEPPSEPSSNS